MPTLGAVHHLWLRRALGEGSLNRALTDVVLFGGGHGRGLGRILFRSGLALGVPFGHFAKLARCLGGGLVDLHDQVGLLLFGEVPSVDV